MKTGAYELPAEDPELLRPGSERRTLQRHSGITIDTVSLDAAGQVFDAAVHDISIEGIGLVANQPLEPGTPLTIGPKKNPGLCLPAQVKHKNLLPGTRWLLGCAFTTRLKTEDILELG